ncbi:hypothetical protein CsSME_00044466 [Camellia sinensis var. sinensis]
MFLQVHPATSLIACRVLDFRDEIKTCQDKHMYVALHVFGSDVNPNTRNVRRFILIVMRRRLELMQLQLYGFDNEPRSPGDAPQSGKKKKKCEKSAAEIALLVENVMAELEVVVEEDVELNRQSKLFIDIMFPFYYLWFLSCFLHQLLIHHGVLTLLKTWLEPLLHGSLPNINIRRAILRILTDFPIDLEHYDRREQLKKSGLGKIRVIMFMWKSDEETTANKRMSTRFEDIRNFDDEKVSLRRPSPMNKASRMESRDDDLDLPEFSQDSKSGQSSSMHLTLRPEAMPMYFLVCPQSKIDPDEVRAHVTKVVQDQRRLKMQKKLQQLKPPKKK